MLSIDNVCHGVSVSCTPLWSSIALLAYLMLVAPASADAPTEVAMQASTSYKNEPVTLTAELYKPQGDGPFPAVVLMHGCGGLTPAVQVAMKRHASNFVSNQFVALILDSFGPRGNSGGWVCGSGGRLMSARIYRKSDALDALQYLQSLEFVDRANIFQMGQSNGGSVAILLAQQKDRVFRAISAYYPWCGAFSRLGYGAELTSPLIVFAGELDDWTPPKLCTSIEPRGADYSVVVYPGAVHSFDLEMPVHNYHGHKLGHNANATRQSREQMVSFFVEHMTEEGRARMPTLVQIGAPAMTFLTGPDIQSLMPTRKLKGINGYGNPFTITYTANGGISGVAGKNDEYKDTGKWWVEDGAFCRQYHAWLEGEAACFKVTLDGENIGFYDSAEEFVSSGTFKR
jgi:dienelactone hydrolase